MPLVTLPDYDYYDLVNTDHELAQGLVIWWRVMPGWYGGTIWRDLMKRNNATLTGITLPYSSTSGMALGSTRPGGDGEVRFDGTDDYGTIDGFLATTSLPVSVSLVLYIRSGSTGIRQALANTGGTNTRFYLGLQSAGSSALGFRCGNVTISTAISDLTWYHLCGVWDGNGGMECYLNGLSIGTNSSTGVTTFNNIMKIGAYGNGASSYWEGGIDNIIIHQEQLSSAKVAALYQSSRLGHHGLLRCRVYRYFSIPSGVVPTVKKIIGGGLLPMVA